MCIRDRQEQRPHHFQFGPAQAGQLLGADRHRRRLDAVVQFQQHGRLSVFGARLGQQVTITLRAVVHGPIGVQRLDQPPFLPQGAPQPVQHRQAGIEVLRLILQQLQHLAVIADGRADLELFGGAAGGDLVVVGGVGGATGGLVMLGLSLIHI